MISVYGQCGISAKVIKMISFYGQCGISAKVIKDSISQYGKRITTFELVYPRWILAEVNTHRTISKNSASSRAVPFDKMISIIKESPAMPVYWGKNQSGMTAKEELSLLQIDGAKGVWEAACAAVTAHSVVLNDMGLHKQTVNRLCEPWSMMKTVATGTDWDNLLWLRNDQDAQPEFKELAWCIQECFDVSTPELLNAGVWHLPYISTNANGDNVDSDGVFLELEDAQKISASCCAQVSYRRLNESKEKAIEIYGKLFAGRKPHMSPTEHQATPIPDHVTPNDPSTWAAGVTHLDRSGALHSGNFSGWVQYRQTLPNNVFVRDDVLQNKSPV